VSVTIILENKGEKGDCCRWCGSRDRGSGCPYSPNGVHEAVPINSKECIFCGKSHYGRGCPWSPDKGTHKHGSDGKKCRYCGSHNLGSGCPYSPNGKHQR